MTNMLIEENREYGIDCSKACWKTDEIHYQYQAVRLHLLKDVDFVIETEDDLIVVEYKNSMIRGAASRESFNPGDDKTLNAVVRKYYDSLHYLTLMGKLKPKRYVYVVEAKNSDAVMRSRLRDRISKELPFALQNNIGGNIRLIESIDVLSISEWNAHDRFGKFPFVKLGAAETTTTSKE